MTNDELRAQLTDNLNDAEARMEAAGVPDRVLKRFKHAHAIMADIAHDLIDGGHITPFSPVDKP